MNARKRRVLLFGFVATTSLAAAGDSVAGLLDLFTNSQPPVKAHVRMGTRGIAFRHDFHITKYCVYDFELRLNHRYGRMGEFDSLLQNDTLPIAMTVDVYRYDGESAARVARLGETPRLSGRGVTMTILKFGSAKLDEGRYRAEVSSEGEAPQLEGIEADFVAQIRPKTSCPKKGG
jgi:hypothetical protein